MKLRPSYPMRLFLWLLAYSLLMVGCFVLFQYHREKEFKAEEINSQLQLINAYLLDELAKGNDVSSLDLKQLHPFEDLRISVISRQGDVIYDNTLDSIKRSNHLNREEIRQAIEHNAGFAVRRHSESTGEYYFYSARKDDTGRIVRTAVPYSVSLSTLLEADYTFLWMMGAITIVMCLLGYFATRRVGDHILRLNKFAENVERGDKISDTAPFPDDELGNISNHIVLLYARLQKANADRDAEHRAAMHEQQEKERIKKQLTNNINHELKTPVAGIQLCIETLLAHNDDLSAERRKIFLQRCQANTDRLRKLLADVTLINRMDEGAEATPMTQVDLAEIVSAMVAAQSDMAAGKGVAIHNNISGSLPMQGNVRLLESIFSNLIDNVIAYSEADTLTISVIRITAKNITLTVSDNGTGIPPEHLERIFERFYRIDKGRSRAAGGTGLGLSIVKNAVTIHGGTIRAENLPSGGLLFRFTLSRNQK